MTDQIPAPAAAALADAREKLRKLGGCALLIGVEAYNGLPAEKQLHAGRNDVLSYWKVCRRLGYRQARAPRQRSFSRQGRYNHRPIQPTTRRYPC